MFWYAFIFFVLDVAAAIFAFGDFFPPAKGIATLLFGVFLALWFTFLLLGIREDAGIRDEV